MSFLPISEQNQQAPQGQTAGAPPPQAGGSAGAGQAGGSSPTGSPTQFGSSASKLGDYLSANAPQIGAQAEKVAGGLNTQYGQVQGDITNAANQFGQQIQGGYAASNPNVVNQAVANPTGFASNAQNVKDFQGQYNDAYTGPQSFTGSAPYSAINNEVNTAVQNAGLLNTQAGLGSYLGNTQGGNTTQASNTLDALLLQGNPAAQQTIQTAANQFGGLTEQLGSRATSLDAAAKAATPAAQAAQQYAQGQLGNAVTGFNTGLTDQFNTAQNQRNAYNAALNQYQTAEGTLSPALQNVIAAMNQGGNPQVNFTDPYATILKNNPISVNAPTMGSVATPQEYAQMAALQQLGGQNIQSPLSGYNPNQAGTYQAPGTLPTAMNPQQLQDLAAQINQDITQYTPQYVNNGTWGNINQAVTGGLANGGLRGVLQGLGLPEGVI